MTKAQGEQLVDAAESSSGNGLRIELGGDPIYRAQEGASPEGLGFLGAAIVLLISGLIGIGVGIDYALLVLTRFRTAMADGKDRHDAVVEAVTTAGRSVLIAGSTVVSPYSASFSPASPTCTGWRSRPRSPSWS